MPEAVAELVDAEVVEIDAEGADVDEAVGEPALAFEPAGRWRR